MRTLSPVAEVRMAESAAVLVTKAKKLQASASGTSWELADTYLALKEKHGWSDQKVADACDVGRVHVRRFRACAENWSLGTKRPAFWDAFQEINTCTVRTSAHVDEAFRGDSIPGKTSSYFRNGIAGARLNGSAEDGHMAQSSTASWAGVLGFVGTLDGTAHSFALSNCLASCWTTVDDDLFVSAVFACTRTAGDEDNT